MLKNISKCYVYMEKRQHRQQRKMERFGSVISIQNVNLYAVKKKAIYMKELYRHS